jgi:UDP-N-acetylglucosamine/UDP-N-acetylgalactosamine diphosphorylase
MVNLEELTKRFTEAGQGHVFQYYNTLGEEDRSNFLSQLVTIPVEKLSAYLSGAKAIHDNVTIHPFEGSVATSHHSDASKWRDLGIEAIEKGHVAAIVLAGGQGTRLGYEGPKGCFNIQLPSQKTLFQLFAERIARLQQISSNGDATPIVPLYVMTSPLNHNETVSYFKKNDDFGIQVHFFPQGMLPCLDMDGKIILEGPGVVAMAPDGNGGIYPALQSQGMLQQMVDIGIQHVHVFSIDNALCRPADPSFLGYCIAKDADVGNKVLWKAEPHEAVGVMATKNGRSCIVEYSDITLEMAEMVDENGKLIFGAANICNHYFKLDFLTTKVVENMANMYHIAHKKIAFFDGSNLVHPKTPNGIKLESFIFDVFELSQNMAVLEVERRHEFAPVKNATGKDSPETARAFISALGKEYLEMAGAIVHCKSEEHGGINEISPLTSYAGEGLEGYQGCEMECPFSI